MKNVFTSGMILFLAMTTTVSCTQENIGGKTKCVKMNETLNQWKAL